MDIPQDFLSLFYKEEKRFLIDSLLIKRTKFVDKLRPLFSRSFLSMNQEIVKRGIQQIVRG